MSLIFLLAVILSFKSGEGELRILHEPEDFYGNKRHFDGLSCSVAEPSHAKFRWYHNGTLVDREYSLKFRSFDTADLWVDKSKVDLRYQGIYQPFVSSSFGTIFGRKIEVKFKVGGKFESGKTKETRKVIIGQPYRLQCPEHSYSSGCFYKWGKSTVYSGLSHIQEYNNRVLLEDGTLFFSTVQERDVREFNENGEGYMCILECAWSLNDHFTTLSHGILLDGSNVDNSTFGPSIVTKFKDREILVGSKYVQFRCAASGSPTPRYRWVKIDEVGTVKNIVQTEDVKLGNFNHTLTIKNVKKTHNGTYGCIATINDTNRIKQDIMQGRIIVREGPKWLSDGKISSKAVDIFSKFTWECKAYSDPTPAYTWYANGTELTTEIGKYEIRGGKITFSRLLVENTGMYECVAENSFGYIYQTAALVVRARKPKFNQKSVNVVLLAEGKGVITCWSNAIPLANNTWTKDGEEIILSKNAKYSIRGKQDLIINKVTKEDEGIYECTAINVFGKDKQTTNVTIGDIKFLETPKNQNILKGKKFSLSCEATSSFRIKYKWRFDNLELVYDDNHVWSLDVHTLYIFNASESDSGKYECVVYIDRPAKVESIRSATVVVKGPPRAPRVFYLKQDCTNSTAILVWHPLASYNISETNITIEWRTTYDLPGVWHQLSRRINSRMRKTKVKNLPSWSKIQFRAIAQNIFGSGEPSEETQFDHCETPPARPVKCPENFQGVPQAPGVLEIKWKPMTVMDYNGPGFTYHLKYRPFNASTWHQVVLGGAEDKFTVSNAGINQLWYFKIRANNSEGFGPICPENNSSSGQPKPGLISSLIVKEITATSVLVTWVPLPLEKGTIDGYKLEYWQTEATVYRRRRQLNSICKDYKTPCRASLPAGRSGEHRLTNLIPMTRYNLSLRAHNSAGDGPRKYSMFQTTAPISGKFAAPIYKQDWFISVVSAACVLMLVVLIIILIQRQRGERYPVRKRELAKGGFRNLEDDLSKPYQTTDVVSEPYPTQSVYHSNESNMGDDANSLASSTEDKYEEDGSFLGEYGDVGPFREYQQIFV